MFYKCIVVNMLFFMFTGKKKSLIQIAFINSDDLNQQYMFTFFSFDDNVLSKIKERQSKFYNMPYNRSPTAQKTDVILQEITLLCYVINTSTVIHIHSMPYTYKRYAISTS